MLGEEGKVASSIIKSTPGPIAKRVSDLEAVLRVVMSEEAYDMARFYSPQPYNMEIAHGKEKLRVGYFIDSDLMKVCPSSRRAVEMAKAALEKRGHTVVAFDIGSVKDMFKAMIRIYSQDQSKTACKSLIQEPGDIGPIKESLKFS